MSDRIVVVDYGMGNIHSILKALRLYADDVVYTADVDEIRNARCLVLPGDGAFGAAMQGLAPLEASIREFVEQGRPLLGVCIGFQVLFEDSDEIHDGTDRYVRGLGLIRGNIRRFHFSDDHVRVPHMGWNRLIPAARPQATDGDYVYFIHSYRAENVPSENIVAYCDYAGDVFPAIVTNDRGNVVAAQFHPEKSDAVGLSMLQAWVREPERQFV